MFTIKCRMPIGDRKTNSTKPYPALVTDVSTVDRASARHSSRDASCPEELVTLNANIRPPKTPPQIVEGESMLSVRVTIKEAKTLQLLPRSAFGCTHSASKRRDPNFGADRPRSFDNHRSSITSETHRRRWPRQSVGLTSLPCAPSHQRGRFSHGVFFQLRAWKRSGSTRDSGRTAAQPHRRRADLPSVVRRTPIGSAFRSRQILRTDLVSPQRRLVHESED